MAEALPSGIKFTKASFDLDVLKSVFQSGLTKKRTFQSANQGKSDTWEGTLTTTVLSHSEVNILFGWMLKVGFGGEFDFIDPDFDFSGLANGLVNGASQTGTSIICDGFPINTKVISAGHPFALTDGYKVATADATTNGTGQVTINFEPAIRVSPANNSAVTMISPVMTSILLTKPSKDTDALKNGAPFTFAFEEK